MTKQLTVRDIVLAYLDAHGYDGLCTVGCGCGKDDLMPCQDPHGECVPAYRVTPTEEQQREYGIGPDDPWYAPERNAK